MTWHYKDTDRAGWTTPHSAEQTDNAAEIWLILVDVNGWTEEAAAAVLGNMQHESYINPAQWEIGYNYSMQHGFGLGQWTPATKISNYVGSTNHDAMADGAKQMNYLVSTPSQYNNYYLNPDGTSTYYSESGVPYFSDMDDFSHSTASVRDLTKTWAICWEKPRASAYANSIQDRMDDAEYWYTTFHGSPPTPPPTPPTPEEDSIPWLAIFMSKMVR